MLFRRVSVFLSLLVSQVLAHSHISRHRHLVIDDLSMVVIMADADMTQGPFAEQDSDYVNSTDLTEAGRAGFSPGVEEDRLTVVDGVPLEFTITVYDVADNTTGIEYENVEVFIWHCDAAGVYSAIEPGLAQGIEGLDDQYWLRGKQVTGADGKVTFRTILPGWYGNRALHYHVRLRFAGEMQFAATTQLFIADSDLALYENIPLYSDTNPGNFTPLATDALYSALDPVLAEALTLNLEGTVEAGFSASINLGLVPGSVSDFPGGFTWPPCLLDENGTPPTLPPSGEAPELPDECFNDQGEYTGGEHINNGSDGEDLVDAVVLGEMPPEESATPDDAEATMSDAIPKNTMLTFMACSLLVWKHLNL